MRAIPFKEFSMSIERNLIRFGYGPELGNTAETVISQLPVNRVELFIYLDGITQGGPLLECSFNKGVLKRRNPKFHLTPPNGVEANGFEETLADELREQFGIDRGEYRITRIWRASQFDDDDKDARPILVDHVEVYFTTSPNLNRAGARDFWYEWGYVNTAKLPQCQN